MQSEAEINNRLNVWSVSGWIFGTIVFTVGILNLLLVHPVPGIAYLMLSLIYFPLANTYLMKKTGFVIPVIIKVTLGIVLIMFTLGVSDLGDMIDKL
ncbi:hypothetical protein [uncultured Pontibacter sp.]|uniref:hypothetical protein n=1 Tax=uncultured Pontibacter sp. TaxID=453356 RepID=UPI002616141F|nr:hypothetical protein [uncultured Pontibacter sp.]